jgi:hypothetical protein
MASGFMGPPRYAPPLCLPSGERPPLRCRAVSLVLLLPGWAPVLAAPALGRPDALAATLQAAAEAARKGGHLAAADASLGRMRGLIRQAAAADPSATAPGGPPGSSKAVPAGRAPAALAQVLLQGAAWWQAMARPDAPWLLEAVKLMWDRGQAAAALRELQGLIAAVEGAARSNGLGGGGAAKRGAAEGGCCGGEGDVGGAAGTVHLARLLSLAGKWTAATQHGGGKTSAVLELLSRGAEALQDGGGGRGRLACQVYFRLAAFADERYK